MNSKEPMDPSSDPIESFITSNDPQSTIATLLVEYTSKSNPLLAHLLRVSVVPRRFDEPLLAVLTHRSVYDKEFLAAVHDLLAMPYVVRRHDGRYRIHDKIRNALLSQLEKTDRDRKLVRTLNELLTNHYAAEHERARIVADQFDTVTGLLREVSPERLPAMRSAIETQLVQPLIEAQHYVTTNDPSGAGLTQFKKWFELYENERRIEVCRLLLRSWQDDLERLPGRPEASLDDWCSYYQGRLALAQGNGETARKISKRILARPDLALVIRVLTQELVTDSLVADCRFVEALEQTKATLMIRSGDDPDPGTRWRIFIRQAKIHQLLYDGSSQETSLENALGAARSAGNREIEASIFNQLSALRAMEGDIQAAADYAMKALHIVRTFRSPRAGTVAAKCAIQLMRTFGARDPRFADLYHIEASHLTRGDDTQGAIEVEVTYASALIRIGKFQRAHDILDQLENRVGDQRLLGRSGFFIVRANLLDAEGREREAVERNRRTVAEVERNQGNIWDQAAALTNAATTEMDIADLLDEAWSSAMRARALWQSMGHKRGVNLTNVVMAEVNRRRADYVSAAARLSAERPLPALGLEDLWYWTAARLAGDLGRRDEASDYLRYVLDSSIRTGQLRVAARAAALLIEVLIRADRHDAAENVTEVLIDVMGGLSKLRRYQHTDVMNLADEHNGRALRLLSAVSERPYEAVRSAIQHLDEAIDADPEPFWYSLNQAYAFLRINDNGAVEEAMDAAKAKSIGTPFEDAILDLSVELRNFGRN